MLATKFKPDEPVVVVTPSSINTSLLPDADVMLITIDKDGRVFFSIDGQKKRQKLISDLDESYKLGLTEPQKTAFILGSSYGTDIKDLKRTLEMTPDEQKTQQKGIPLDSANNELGVWLEYGRTAQAAIEGNSNKLKYCIKADNQTPYPVIKKCSIPLKRRRSRS
ncbi:biopolymer transporter ExbD [Chitinophaga sedimenti]|uniref:biopolymer transporter ExbD n=1 Tax=Chitinophaga sedimenti TaxID=2033606 RepID=UPI0020066089|nr:biopolymer transporter ExbD [Chitinophaga sedimenti]MCK7557605.1 biopolymer transporter ExbD [Chitinophaga sedimenti]